MKTFHHLEFKELADPFDGIIARTVFDNEYGVSVVRSQFSYGGKMGLYELAILDNNGEVCYTTPLTDNVIGYLRDIDITEVMIKVQQLPPIKKNHRRGDYSLDSSGLSTITSSTSYTPTGRLGRITVI